MHGMMNILRVPPSVTWASLLEIQKSMKKFANSISCEIILFRIQTILEQVPLLLILTKQE